MKPRHALLALGAALLLAHAAPAFAQCAMCQATLSNSADGHAMMGGFNKAILIMFAAPYVVFACCGVILFHRRIREALAARLGLQRTS